MKDYISKRLGSVNFLAGLWTVILVATQCFLLMMFVFGFVGGVSIAAADESLADSVGFALSAGADPEIVGRQVEEIFGSDDLFVRAYDEGNDTLVLEIGDLQDSDEERLSSTEYRQKDAIEIDSIALFWDENYTGDGGEEFTVVVASSRSFPSPAADQTTVFLLLGGTAIAFVIALVNGIIISLILRLVLGKVHKIRKQVETISLGTLDRRVPASGSSDAIDQLAGTMNVMLERLQRSNDQQAQFLADVSHELRSPITGIVTQLEVAERYPDRVDPQRMLPQVLSESRRAKNVVDDLMFMSRLEAEGNGQAAPNVEPVDATRIVESEAAAVRELDPNVAVTVKTDDGVVIRADANKFTRVVRNLLTNASRHAEYRVRVELSQRDGLMFLDIRDDGQGIVEDDRRRIFDRFVRLDEARTRDTGGSGLGLAMTREIVESYLGRVWVEPPTSETDGAHFRVAIPLWNPAGPAGL